MRLTGCLAIALALAMSGCGGSSGEAKGSKPTERELLTQTRAQLSKTLHPQVDGETDTAYFDVPTGTCRIDVIATGADAPTYAGFPWSVESPDGEVVVKVGNEGGALQEDCNAAITDAMGW